ncbi:2-oxoglutarate ferredoxin oxidoreductase subunit gamma [Bacteroidia bacterium]|nr:2-oxoglutarate ferredoxin oxidoreductase subunit gamma [Bacteroidia bacterium]
MTEELIIAGFGGQGVLSMGKILAYAGIVQGKEVTWMPSYGPEMRGGTANVTVVLSGNRISSPIVQQYDSVIVLNQQSMDKFAPCVKRGGVLLYDPNGIPTPSQRTDIAIYTIDATQEAVKMGNAKVFNMIVLGAYLHIKPIVTIENVLKALQKSLPERAHQLIPINEQAIRLGGERMESGEWRVESGELQ